MSVQEIQEASNRIREEGDTLYRRSRSVDLQGLVEKINLSCLGALDLCRQGKLVAALGYLFNAGTAISRAECNLAVFCLRGTTIPDQTEIQARRQELVFLFDAGERANITESILGYAREAYRSGDLLGAYCLVGGPLSLYYRARGVSSADVETGVARLFGTEGEIEKRRPILAELRRLVELAETAIRLP